MLFPPVYMQAIKESFCLIHEWDRTQEETSSPTLMNNCLFVWLTVLNLIYASMKQLVA